MQLTSTLVTLFSHGDAQTWTVGAMLEADIDADEHGRAIDRGYFVDLIDVSRVTIEGLVAESIASDEELAVFAERFTDERGSAYDADSLREHLKELLSVAADRNLAASGSALYDGDESASPDAFEAPETLTAYSF